MLENYEINKTTCAVIPIDDNTSRIIEQEEILIVNQSVQKIIDQSCRYFGSSYVGRFEGTKNLLGYNYKAPIIIEESTELIFFPTSSPRFSHCAWISLKLIKDYQKINRHTLISFADGQDVEFDISFESLDNQILRATRLEAILKKRKLT